MKNITELESGFQIHRLILMESSFSRVKNVIFGGDVKNDLEINTNVTVNNQTITVLEKVSIIQKAGDIEQVKINVSMVGVFERVGETLLGNLDEFGKINGAAIIFPYIREHVTDLSLRANIIPIILPPVNFMKVK